MAHSSSSLECLQWHKDTKECESKASSCACSLARTPETAAAAAWIACRGENVLCITDCVSSTSALKSSWASNSALWPAWSACDGAKQDSV
jgi:hypothetical protein